MECPPPNHRIKQPEGLPPPVTQNYTRKHKTIESQPKRRNQQQNMTGTRTKIISHPKKRNQQQEQDNLYIYHDMTSTHKLSIQNIFLLKTPKQTNKTNLYKERTRFCNKRTLEFTTI
jgi:hypothetical protein